MLIAIWKQKLDLFLETLNGHPWDLLVGFVRFGEALQGWAMTLWIGRPSVLYLRTVHLLSFWLLILGQRAKQRASLGVPEAFYPPTRIRLLICGQSRFVFQVQLIEAFGILERQQVCRWGRRFGPSFQVDSHSPVAWWPLGKNWLFKREKYWGKLLKSFITFFSWNDSFTILINAQV